MYNTIEYFADKDKALDLKEILKSCIYNYYKKRINELQKEKMQGTLNAAISNILSEKKGVTNV